MGDQHLRRIIGTESTSENVIMWVKPERYNYLYTGKKDVLSCIKE